MSTDSIVEGTSYNQGSNSGHYDAYHNGLCHNSKKSMNDNICHEGDTFSDLSGSIIRGNMQYVDGQFKKIPRPLNAFMIFSNEKRKELKREFPGEPNNMISSRLGSAWKALAEEERKRYHDMAHREDLEHRRKYPNYQYSPGHARKLKKARREQRLRQQGNYRSSKTTARDGSNASHLFNSHTAVRKDLSKSLPLNIKTESPINNHPSSSSSNQHSNSQHAESSFAGTANLPGPHGEGHYQVSSHDCIPMSPSDLSGDCMLACCTGCKPSDMYCCTESGWSPDILCSTPGQGYHGMYPPHMMYFPPGYDSHYANDIMQTAPCVMAGECSGCYQGPSLMEPCFTSGFPQPMYPGGDCNGLMYKDVCFIPPELGLHSSANIATSVVSVGPIQATNDTESDLTDISNNMVASCSQDSQASCTSKQSTISPEPMQDISSSDLKEENDAL